MKRLLFLLFVLFALLSFTVYAETPAEAPDVVEAPMPSQPVVDDEECLY